MTAQEVLHTLGDSELHIHHAAITQDHDKEAESPSGLSPH